MILTVENSTSRIGGLSPIRYHKLREVLSCLQDKSSAYFSGARKQRKRYLIDKKGNFPTGLLYLVENNLKKLPLLKTDLRKQPISRPGLFRCNINRDPYPWQIDAVEACLTRHRGIVVAPTGTGKSMMMMMLVQRLQVPTLIVVPSLEIRDQLRLDFTEAFGGLSHISIENVDSLDPKEPCTADCVIIDEFHSAAAKTYRNLNKKAWKDVYYRFGATATPFRTEENERLLLEGVLSEVIYRLTYQEAVAAGYIVPVEAYYIEIPRSVPEKKAGFVEIGGSDSFDYAGVYQDLIVNKPERFVIIHEVINSLLSDKKSTLVLVNQIAHGEMLTVNGYLPFANGQDTDSKQMIKDFNTQKFPVLIGSPILSEGVDTRPCEYVVLAGGTGKSRGALMQMVGRALRRFPGKESAKIIVFYDPSHKWFRKHHTFFKKIMREEYGTVVVKISFDSVD